MEIYSYHADGDYLICDGVCDKWFEILWTRRFLSGDDFTITLPPTSQNISLFAKNQVVELAKKNADGMSNYVGIITSVAITSGEREALTVSGQSADGFLDRRIAVKNGTNIIETLNLNAGSGALADRRLPTVSFMQEDGEPPRTYGGRLAKLSDCVEKTSAAVGWGLRSEISHNTPDPYIRVIGYYAKDRSILQKANSRVIFSDDLGTAGNFDYSANDSGVVNAAVVWSPMQVNQPGLIDVEEFLNIFDNGSGKGFERVEVLKKISPITMTQLRNTAPWTVLDYSATYDEAESVAESSYTSGGAEFFGADITINDGWESKFAIGDIITIHNTAWGVTANKRITEICEYWGADSTTVTATLGDPPKTLKQIMKAGG